MNTRIKILPELVINQIAAGEVIERPASILKELLENSIDASSSMIRIYLENGGISSIKVTDNGEGIHQEDLPLVFVQHATSKINTTADLSKISSLGFRGEALASIASIARVHIVSQQDPPSGTTIEVKDIFYNVPVRRKFLRSKNTEFNYLQEMFKRIALSNFNVGFMLYHNNKLIKSLPAISDDIVAKEKRIIKLFGNKFIEKSIFFNSQLNGMELSGWIANHEDISGSNIQYFYINNRTVKDKLLNAAVKQATYKLSLPQVYCLYITLDPIFFDVNVHPAKQEVRFSDPQVIYAFIYESILEAVDRLTSEIKLPVKQQLELFNNELHHDNAIATKDLAQGSNIISYQNNYLSNEVVNYDNGCVEDNDCVGYDSKININEYATSSAIKNTCDIKLFSIFNNRWVFFEQEINNNSRLVFLNVFSGLRWLVEKKMRETDAIIDFELIIPERLKIDQVNNFEQYIHWLEKFKFEVSQIHENIFLIRKVPVCIKFFDIAINYKNFMNDLVKSKLSDLNEGLFINFITNNMQIEQLDLYTKKDLINLIVELQKEKFCFAIFDEQEFSNLIKI